MGLKMCLQFNKSSRSSAFDAYCRISRIFQSILSESNFLCYLDTKRIVEPKLCYHVTKSERISHLVNGNKKDHLKVYSVSSIHIICIRLLSSYKRSGMVQHNTKA